MKKSTIAYALGGYVVGAYVWNNWLSGYAPGGGLTGINLGLPLDVLSNFNFGVIPTRVLIPLRGSYGPFGQPPIGQQVSLPP